VLLAADLSFAGSHLLPTIRHRISSSIFERARGKSQNGLFISQHSKAKPAEYFTEQFSNQYTQHEIYLCVVHKVIVFLLKHIGLMWASKLTGTDTNVSHEKHGLPAGYTTEY
jgi:hypothetical protein